MLASTSFGEESSTTLRPVMPEHFLQEHEAEITCVAAIGERYAVSGSADGDVRVWDAQRGSCRHHLTGHVDRVRCLTALGQVIASGSDDGSIRLWDVGSGK